MPGMKEKAKRKLMASSARSLSSESIIAQGWLMKQGNYDLGWRRRWVVLIAHPTTQTVGGRQLLWYEDADASSPNGMVQLFAPTSAVVERAERAGHAESSAPTSSGSTRHHIKNYKVKGHRKTGAAVGLPHCFRVEMVHDGSRLILAADTAAIADWWRHTIDSGAASTPQPPQPTVLSLSRVGLVWNTPVDLLLCEDALVVRELGEPEIVFRFDAVKAIECRSGSEIALWALPDHEKHPLLLAGRNKEHAQSVVAEADSHLNEYAQKIAIPWMIERMKLKEADAAARAEERGEIQPESSKAGPEPEPELEPEPEPEPRRRRLLTLEQILDRSLGGGSGSTRDVLAESDGDAQRGSTGPGGVPAVVEAKLLLSRTRSRERPLNGQQDLGDAHQRKLHRSTPPTGRQCNDSGLTTLEEIESEFDWMPGGWRTHYPSRSAEQRTASKDGDLALEPVNSSQSEPGLEADSTSVPPASPTLGMPPDILAPRPSNDPAAEQENSGVEDSFTSGDGGTVVDECHEQYSEFMTVARKSSQTTCAWILRPTAGELKATISQFCEEIKRRADRQHGSHHKTPTEEQAVDCTKILRDVGAFLEAMCAHVLGTHYQDIHHAVQLALKSRAPLRLALDAIEAAIQMGVEWYIGGIAYSMIQKVLLKTAGATRARPATASAAENDSRLLTQRDLLEGKPQRFLEIDPKLISRSEWRKPCATLAKINGSTINGATILLLGFWKHTCSQD